MGGSGGASAVRVGAVGGPLSVIDWTRDTVTRGASAAGLIAPGLSWPSGGPRPTRRVRVTMRGRAVPPAGPGRSAPGGVGGAPTCPRSSLGVAASPSPVRVTSRVAGSPPPARCTVLGARGGASAPLGGARARSASAGPSRWVRARAGSLSPGGTTGAPRGPTRGSGSDPLRGNGVDLAAAGSTARAIPTTRPDGALRPRPCRSSARTVGARGAVRSAANGSEGAVRGAGPTVSWRGGNSRQAPGAGRSAAYAAPPSTAPPEEAVGARGVRWKGHGRRTLDQSSSFSRRLIAAISRTKRCRSGCSSSRISLSGQCRW